MEDLIRQAFLHVEVIGPHVAEGHYDLVGPNGEIILPQVWETMIEPDWIITMHMWPMPEPPKVEDLPPAPEPALPEVPPPPPPIPDVLEPVVIVPDRMLPSLLLLIFSMLTSGQPKKRNRKDLRLSRPGQVVSQEKGSL